jgi:transcriptional regulator with XRE-family HTH domain
MPILRRKTSNRTAAKIDKLIGTNIREHRRLAGLTQAALGAKLGVTFQQVHMYEKGVTSVYSGRLHQIADILEVPVKSLSGAEVERKSSSNSPFDLLDDAMTMRMAREFGKIGDVKTRRAVLAVVETLVGKVKRNS